MRISGLVLSALVCAAVVGAEEPDHDLATLIQRLGSEEYADREQATKRLIDKGIAVLPALKHAVRHEDPEIVWRAAAAFAAICLKGRDRLRAHALKNRISEALHELQLMDEQTRELVGASLTGDGRLLLYYDAQTYEKLDRLAGLEFLVDVGRKRDYECLAGMAESEWKAFATLFERHAETLLLRWKTENGVVVRPLREALPWAVPVVEHPDGLRIGNSDETANPLLPPHGTRIQIGIVSKAPAWAPELPGMSD